MSKIYIAVNHHVGYTIGAYSTAELALEACEQVRLIEDTPRPEFEQWEDGDGLQHWTSTLAAQRYFEVEELTFDVLPKDGAWSRRDETA
jgi:hypothetical protein